MKRMLKKVSVSGMLVLLLAVLYVLPVHAEGEPVSADIGQHTIGIVSTNDIHAHAAGDDSSQLGMAKIKTIIENTRKENELTLALDAGDFYHGQAFATLEKGESMARLAAAVGYDAVSVGNHDWNYGKDQLKNLESISQTGNSDFALLGGNVVNEGGTAFFEHPYIMKELSIDGLGSESGTSYAASVKVGVFGVIDPEIYTSTAPSNVEGLHYTDMAAYTENIVTQLQAAGCQIIIGMAHCLDTEGLASQTSGVDLWIDGHDHISLNTTVTNGEGKEVRVLEAGYYGSEADVTKLTFSGIAERDAEGNVTTTIQELNVETRACLAADTTIEKNPEVQALYEEIAGAQQEILNTVIGKTPVDLAASWENLRIGETTMGRVITDAYLRQTGADIAVENAGGIRTNGTVAAGDIKNQDVINTFPFGNYIVTKQLTGAQVRELLEISIEIGRLNKIANDSGDYNAWPGHSGSYLQIGGIVVHYDPEQEEGKRIWSVTKDGKELEDTTLYTVATNNYMAVSSQYPDLAAAAEVNQYNACDEAFSSYVAADTKEGGLIAASAAQVRMVEEKESVPTPSPTLTPAPTPTIPEIFPIDKNRTHVSGENTTLGFTCAKSVQELQQVRVDGQTVSTEKYSLEGGTDSTLVTLKASYLNTLSEGEHTLEFVYQDGVTTSTTFQITKKSTSKQTAATTGTTSTTQSAKSVNTGDDTSGSWIFSIVVSVLTIAAIAARKKYVLKK